MTGYLEVDTPRATVPSLSMCDGHATGHWPVVLFKRRDRRWDTFWRKKSQVSFWSAKVHPERIKLSTAGKVNWTKAELLSLKRSTIDKKCAITRLADPPVKLWRAIKRLADSWASKRPMSVPSSRRFLDRPPAILATVRMLYTWPYYTPNKGPSNCPKC